MKITKIKIKRIMPNKGHIAFVSFVVDGWLFLNNIAVFTRLNDEEKIRLVFPTKRLKEKEIRLFYPLSSKKYYELEQVILKELNL